MSADDCIDVLRDVVKEDSRTMIPCSSGFLSSVLFNLEALRFEVTGLRMELEGAKKK